MQQEPAIGAGEAEIEFLWAPGIPEVYVDGFRIRVSPYTIHLTLSVANPETLQNRVAAIVRMSPEHAKVMAIIVARTLRGYEASNAEINLPVELLRMHDIDLDREWRR